MDIWVAISVAIIIQCQLVVAAACTCTAFRTSVRTCLTCCGSPQTNQEKPGEKQRDPVRLQLQLHRLSCKRLPVELRLEL